MPTHQENNHWKKLFELIGELDWPGKNKNLLCDFLLDHNDDFALEDTDQGEDSVDKAGN